MAEMPDRPFCADGGTARRAGHEHQASAAGDENTGARKDVVIPHGHEHHRLTCLEPPYTEPYVRWCGRTGPQGPGPTRSGVDVPGLVVPRVEFSPGRDGCEGRVSEPPLVTPSASTLTRVSECQEGRPQHRPLPNDETLTRQGT